MLFFDALRKTARPTETDIGDIRQRVRRIHEIVGYENVSLTDLFALVGEDDRVRPKPAPTPDEPNIERVLPNQVPSNASYINWD